MEAVKAEGVEGVKVAVVEVEVERAVVAVVAESLVR